MSVLLSRLETMPDRVLPGLQVAWDMVANRRAHQADALAALNVYLSAFDIEPVSKSAFSRWVLRIRSGKVRRPGSTAAELAPIAPADQLDRIVYAVEAVAARLDGIEAMMADARATLDQLAAELRRVHGPAATRFAAGRRRA